MKVKERCFLNLMKFNIGSEVQISILIKISEYQFNISRLRLVPSYC